MAGNFAATVLGEGQLPSAKGTLYTVPGGTVTYVRAIRVHNPSGGTETITLYLKPGATSRVLTQAVLGSKETLVIDDPITLQAGDLIEGVTTTATTVDYVITGGEET